MNSQLFNGGLAVLVAVSIAGCATNDNRTDASTSSTVDISKTQIEDSELKIKQVTKGADIVDCREISLSENAGNDSLQLEFSPQSFITGAAGLPAGGPVKLGIPKSRVIKSGITAKTVSQVLAKGAVINNSKIEINQETTGATLNMSGKVLLQVTGKLENKEIGAIAVPESQVSTNEAGAKAKANPSDYIIKTTGKKAGESAKDMFLVAPKT